MPVLLSPTPDGVRIALKVVPGASRDRIVGVLGDALKVAVSKPPEGGAANRVVVQLLANALGIPPKQVEVVKGHTSPRKDVLVRGIALADLRQRVDALVRA
jgi:uncharacterized protein (TIGR00251 family)